MPPMYLAPKYEVPASEYSLLTGRGQLLVVAIIMFKRWAPRVLVASGVIKDAAAVLLASPVGW